MFARHSQATTVPACPVGYSLLWDGYSLLHTEDDGRAHVQDLGQSNVMRTEYIDLFFKNMMQSCLITNEVYY